MSATSSPRRSAESKVRLAVALDVSDPHDAMELARAVAPFVEVAKVGLELFSAVGPAIVTHLIDEGFDVFVDLKLHDIPTTVGHAARSIGRLGATYTTVHAAGGVLMLRAAVEGFAEGAAGAGRDGPVVLGVTVLTSDAAAPPGLLRERVSTILEAGAGGLVCAATDLPVVRALAPKLVAVVPGIRPAGVGSDDQARVATPLEAARLGADVLVLGRALSRAADPRAAAAEIAASLGPG